MFNSEQIENYLVDFNDSALGRLVWTHDAHLLVAVCYLDQYKTVEASIEELRSAIIRLNNANEVANSGVSGYHESITRFMLEAISFFLYHQPETNSRTENVNAVLQSDLKLSKFPYFFYSHALLQSYESRKQWMEPDLRPMSDLSKLLQTGSGF